MRRDLAVDEIADGRWDHLVAAGSGRGWSRAMFLIIEGLHVRIHVLCGSELAYGGTDVDRAVLVYNSVPDGPEAVRELSTMDTREPQDDGEDMNATQSSIDISESIDDTKLRVAQILAILDGTSRPDLVIDGVADSYCLRCGFKMRMNRRGTFVCYCDLDV